MIYLLYSFNNQKTVCLVTNSVSQSKQILIVCYVYVLFNVQVVVCSVLLLLCGWKRIPIVFPFVCSLLFILVVFVFRALLFCLSSNFVLCFIFKLSRKKSVRVSKAIRPSFIGWFEAQRLRPTSTTRSTCNSGPTMAIHGPISKSTIRWITKTSKNTIWPFVSR